MIDSFTHIPFSGRTVRYSIISVGGVTEVDVYTVNDARCSNQLETANETAHKTMNILLFHQNRFTRTRISHSNSS